MTRPCPRRSCPYTRAKRRRHSIAGAARHGLVCQRELAAAGQRRDTRIAIASSNWKVVQARARGRLGRHASVAKVIAATVPITPLSQSCQNGPHLSDLGLLACLRNIAAGIVVSTPTTTSVRPSARRLSSESRDETNSPTPAASTARVATMKANRGGLSMSCGMCTSTRPQVQTLCTGSGGSGVEPSHLSRSTLDES